MKAHFVVGILALTFFILPFFWFKPGELDIGGDSTRLYLYDPIAYLRSTSLFSIDPQGTVKVMPNQNLLPYLLVTALLQKITHSTYLPVSLEKSIKLSLSFLFMYLLVRNFLANFSPAKKSLAVNTASILAGVFYTLSPSVTENLGFALLTHNQVFLNPMMTYFILELWTTQNLAYLWIALLTTLIFSPNFNLMAPPALFSFFPLTLIFLYIYVTRVLRRQVPWRLTFTGIIFFLALHTFHIVPTIVHIVSPGSDLYAKTFGISSNAVDYFNAILGLGKVSNFLLMSTVTKLHRVISIVPPVIILLGFMIGRPKKLLLLVGVFFLITLFLMSANITHFGVEMYRRFFLIPGFGMFRNFAGQWQFVYTFFYFLLFGLSLGYILQKFKKKNIYWLSLLLLVIVGISSWQFISGETTDVVRYNGVKATVVMDTRYERILSFVRTLPADGKILALPLNDYYFQILQGINNGVYIGPSTIAYLTGRDDFPAYQMLYPFSEVFMRLSREKKYGDLKKLLGLLNVRFIFYNADPKIYDSSFPGFPYSYMRTSLPKTQEEYALFIQELGAKKIYENGPYQLSDLGTNYFVPIVSMPRVIYMYENNRDDWYGQNTSFFTDNVGAGPTVAYVLRQDCLSTSLDNFCNSVSSVTSSTPAPIIEPINPTKYKIIVKNIGSPLILVLSNNYDASWSVYVDTNKPIRFPETILSGLTQRVFNDSDIFETVRLTSVAAKRHFKINGYANAWLIEPADLRPGKNVLIIETQAQRIFYVSLLISASSFVLFIFWGAFFGWRRLRRLSTNIR